MEKHTFFEDMAAIVTGSILIAQGMFLLKSSYMVMGGTAGIALLLIQFVPISFGTTYFLVNTPFYFLAWKRLGARFTINSIIAVSLVSICTDTLHYLVQYSHINSAYSSVLGGICIGLGLLILFRHRASLGGTNVLCLVIQDKMGISVGKTQLTIDTTILICSLFFIPPMLIAWSILCAVVINIILWMNHKPTRYSVSYNK